MTPAFLNALAKTLGFEGGIVDDPNDRGGLTKWGITQRTYDAWRVTTGQGTRPVTQMGDREMRQIYFDEYWTPLRADEMPEDLAAAVFDMAVNSGHGNAVRTLQRSLGLDADGVIGPLTIGACARGSVLAFLRRRGGFIQDVIRKHPSDVEFLEGWINRLLDQAAMKART